MSELRWGLIGTGDVVRKRVLAAIQGHPECRVLGACRGQQALLREFCEAHEIPRGYGRAEELLADGESDCVYIATPVSMHAAQAIAAARAGKHVLLEKPMAMNVEECERIIEAARENGVVLSVAYYRRFYPLYRRMKELVRSGAVGEVLSVSAVTASAFRISPGEPGYWRVIPELGGGGPLMDIGCHRLDLFVDLFGAPQRVAGVCKRVSADYAAEDAATVIMDFENGPVGNLMCLFGSNTNPDEFAIQGTTGRLVARPLEGSTLLIESRGETKEERHEPAENLSRPLIDDFVRAVREGSRPTVTGEQGREVNRVIELAYRGM